MAYAARIGQHGQLVGEGAQGFQEFRVGACSNVVHEGCSVSFEVVSHPIRRTTALPVTRAVVGNRSPTWTVCAVLSSINDGFVPSHAPAINTRNRSRTALIQARPATLRLPWVCRYLVQGVHRHFVKAKGLRWLNLMWLTDIPWALRICALPFLTVLAPSSRYMRNGADSTRCSPLGRARGCPALLAQSCTKSS